MNEKTLSIVVSAYNESGNLEKLYGELRDVAHRLLPVKTELVFVNDGSSDDTLAKLKAMQAGDSRIKIVNLS
ncbi:MAG: glycosyltransferase, partial [Rickettsiales bacterium]|nr:glycosyltransferase [Rickettsiales bacterium]